ncbi:hypothetical protein GCM10027187_02210 [Streptosporangium sandarakinum]
MRPQALNGQADRFPVGAHPPDAAVGKRDPLPTQDVAGGDGGHPDGASRGRYSGAPSKFTRRLPAMAGAWRIRRCSSRARRHGPGRTGCEGPPSAGPVTPGVIGDHPPVRDGRFGGAAVRSLSGSGIGCK